MAESKVSPDPFPDSNRWQPSILHEALAIALGGSFGASLRFAIARGTEVADQDAAWATLIANLIGAFLLGVLVSRVEANEAHPLLRSFLVVGVFGSFTTFSALALDNRSLASQHGEFAALMHITGSVLAGLLAFSLGNAVFRAAR